MFFIINTSFTEADIQRVRKLTIDNVYCVACAKQSLEEMAVGLANGQVKLYNYKKSEFIHKFNAGNFCNWLKGKPFCIFFYCILQILIAIQFYIWIIMLRTSI